MLTSISKLHLRSGLAPKPQFKPCPDCGRSVRHRLVDNRRVWHRVERKRWCKGSALTCAAKGCTSKATTEVFNHHNSLLGQYCRQHAALRVKELSMPMIPPPGAQTS